MTPENLQLNNIGSEKLNLALDIKIQSNLDKADIKYSGNLYLTDSSYKHRKNYYINRPK